MSSTSLAKRGLNSSEYVELIKIFTLALEKHKDYMNSLNVFPVPDADTGTNMYVSIKGIQDSLKNKSNLNNFDIQGRVVIGEGELDDAPMLYIGEKLGTNKGPEFDIAVDPLEGTNFAANNLPGALSVIAMAEKNNLFKAPETYMEKISTKINEKNVVDLDYTVKKNISNFRIN